MLFKLSYYCTPFWDWIIALWIKKKTLPFDFNWTLSEIVIQVKTWTDINCMHLCRYCTHNLNGYIEPLCNLLFSPLPPAHHKMVRCAVRGICCDTQNCPESFYFPSCEWHEKRDVNQHRQRERETDRTVEPSLQQPSIPKKPSWNSCCDLVWLSMCFSHRELSA